ncbi:hypothetical protein BJ508DRAFT_342868 [Ascobolus immersus RN42]|uniref:Uncharacterized protein n=1 Tax=Ascobolus immersus RN42 TaxID=1160509 RepID=A0A3N4HEM0_ASCIM|nr:hypothetical protein BJ508DRAFT_342868 [Ascobolus immersus RN42]
MSDPAIPTTQGQEGSGSSPTRAATSGDGLQGPRPILYLDNYDCEPDSEQALHLAAVFADFDEMEAELLLDHGDEEQGEGSDGAEDSGVVAQTETGQPGGSEASEGAVRSRTTSPISASSRSSRGETARHLGPEHGVIRIRGKEYKIWITRPRSPLSQDQNQRLEDLESYTSSPRSSHKSSDRGHDVRSNCGNSVLGAVSPTSNTENAIPYQEDKSQSGSPNRSDRSHGSIQDGSPSARPESRNTSAEHVSECGTLYEEDSTPAQVQPKPVEPAKSEVPPWHNHLQVGKQRTKAQLDKLEASLTRIVPRTVELVRDRYGAGYSISRGIPVRYGGYYYGPNVGHVFDVYEEGEEGEGGEEDGNADLATQS